MDLPLPAGANGGSWRALCSVIGSDELPASTVASTCNSNGLRGPLPPRRVQRPHLGRADCVEVQIFGWLLEHGSIVAEAPRPSCSRRRTIGGAGAFGAKQEYDEAYENSRSRSRLSMNIRRELRIAALTIVIILAVALAFLFARGVVTKLRDMARSSSSARILPAFLPACETGRARPRA